jgi:hypothetical protein
VNDTPPDFAARVSEIHAAMTPEQRWRAASSMFDTARAIVDSSLPPSLSPAERRIAIARRFYGHELPDAAIAALGRCTRIRERAAR